MFVARRLGFSLATTILLGGVVGAVTPRAAVAQINESSVLVLYDLDSAEGLAIAQHYAEVHPGVRLGGLDLSGLSSPGEQISAEDYLGVVRPQVLAALDDSISVIVTTKGMPLRINAGPNANPGPQSYYSQYSSLESELTRIDTISTLDQLRNQSWWGGNFGVPDTLPANPYYLGAEATSGGLVQSPIGFNRSDPVNEGIRLTARLDGFTTDDVINAIDRARDVYYTYLPTGTVVMIDDDPLNVSNVNDPVGTPSSDRLELLRDTLANAWLQVRYDGSDTAMTTSNGLVLGYFSFGTNDKPSTDGLGPGYITQQLDLRLANGAVFHSYESFNAFSFDPAKRRAGQGLVGDWLSIGGTAAIGHVEEPKSGNANITNVDVMIEMLRNGYTFAEAAWAGTRQLSYVNTVIGDPLMRWKLWVPGDLDFDGQITSADFVNIAMNFGRSSGATLADGDIDGDGDVDSVDLTYFYSALSLARRTTNVSFENIVVLPEPGTALVFVGALAALMATRRRVR